jgi:hypothetical protein
MVEHDRLSPAPAPSRPPSERCDPRLYEIVDLRVLGQPLAVARVVEVLRASFRIAKVSGTRPNRRELGVRMHVQVLVDREAPAAGGRLDLRETRAIVTDGAVLRRVTLEALSAYLVSHGWTEVEGTARASHWRHGARADTTWVLLPRRPDVGDYANRMSDALSELAEVEDRSQLGVLADLLSAPGGAEEDGRDG